MRRRRGDDALRTDLIVFCPVLAAFHHRRRHRISCDLLRYPEKKSKLTHRPISALFAACAAEE
jgi:hypothetical protein